MDIDNLNTWIFDIALPEYGRWLGTVAEEAAAHPLLTAALVGCCILIGILGRSAWFFGSALILAMLFLDTRRQVQSPVLHQGLLGLSVIGLATLAIGALLMNRKVAIGEKRRAALEHDRDKVRKILDKEITWRRAADKSGLEHPDASSADASDTVPR